MNSLKPQIKKAAWHIKNLTLFLFMPTDCISSTNSALHQGSTSREWTAVARFRFPHTQILAEAKAIQICSLYMMDIYSRTPSPSGTSSFPSSVYNCLFSVKNIQRGCTLHTPINTIERGLFNPCCWGMSLIDVFLQIYPLNNKHVTLDSRGKACLMDGFNPHQNKQ